MGFAKEVQPEFASEDTRRIFRALAPDGDGHGVQRSRARLREGQMVLCPVAFAVGCKKCPVFNLCPAKAIIGDYKQEKPPDQALKGDRGPLPRAKGKK